MNTIVTSREAILSASRALVMNQGWSAVSIRSVAAACGVSVGSIYNYFESKADLVAATVESAWQDIFQMPAKPLEGGDFLGSIEWLFASMQEGNRRYPGILTLHSMGFLGESKEKGRQMMQHSLSHICQGLLSVLRQDPRVRADAFAPPFTEEKFIDLLFSMVIIALLREDYDCAPILELTRRCLY